MLSPDHVIFSAGNTFQILNLKTSDQINMRSTSGGGVGAIAVSQVKLLGLKTVDSYLFTVINLD